MEILINSLTQGSLFEFVMGFYLALILGVIFLIDLSGNANKKNNQKD